MTRIAIIGGGPKALYGLLELDRLCSGATAEDLRVDVFDPYPPGAGRVWQITQPRVVRLNVPASIVDAGLASGPGTFAEWTERVEPRYRDERYPPRTVVGHYLQDQFESLVSAASFELHHVAAKAHEVSRSGRQWLLRHDAGKDLYDEVVLATGHGLPGERSHTPLSSAINQEPLIGDYLCLGDDSIPASAQVLIRGAALTAYDAALILTEGRGGRWEDYERGQGHFLRYLASGREPAGITMGSPSNLPMEPKPEHVSDAVRTCVESYRQSLRQWAQSLATEQPSTGASYTEMWRILLACARECAQICGVSMTPLTLWRTALTGRPAYRSSAEREREFGTDSVAEHIRQSIAAGRQHAAPSAQWLWGRVWSGLYPEILRAVSRVRWQPAQSQVFSRITKQLERMASGPPERTALKILALFDSGILKQLPWEASPTQHILIIDAVTPPPGVLTSPWPHGRPRSPLVEGLLVAGEVMIRPGDRGVLTDTDGTCINARGNRNETLAAFGRPTDGPTLDHDTLNRTLHVEHQHWAQRIARRHFAEYTRGTS